MTRLQDVDKPLHTLHFESPSHTGTLLCGLQALRCKGLLLDVTLIAEGESFHAHKAVLASCSDYFRAMFTDAMKESRENEIKLNGVSAAGIRLLLDYAYSSRLALTLANIQDVLSAASHVQVFAVVEACSNYLQAQLDLENCIDIATLAETYSLPQLRKRVYRFMSAHLREFSRSPDFQLLSFAQLEHLLACDFPVDCSEHQVLQIVLQWLKYGCDKRHHFGQRLLKKIDFAEVLNCDIDSSLTYTQDPFLSRLIILEACKQKQRVTRCNIPAQLINSRGMELAIVKVGGFGLGGITNEVTYYLSSSNKWRHLTSIPHVEQCNFGTAVLDNELYVVGGCFNQSLQENIHPFGFRFCARSNKWSTMAPMHRERCRFSLNVVGGRLFAVGGSNETEEDDMHEEETSLCECYDPVTDSWENFTSMSGHRSQHAGAAWPQPSSVSHYLFISGGLDRDVVLSTMLCYDVRTDCWEERTPMLTARADHVMLTIGDRMYICGGWSEDEGTGGRVLVDTIDSYDVASDRWETVTKVPYPRYHAGIVAVNNKIYFIGGFHSDAMFDRATASIDCYDIETNVWRSEEKYPQDVWEHTCVSLYVPRCRDDMEILPLVK